MCEIYIKAANILKKIIEKGESLKSLSFKENNQEEKNIKIIYAIVSESLKCNSCILKFIIFL